MGRHNFCKKNQNNSHMVCVPYFIYDKFKRHITIYLKNFVFLQTAQFKLTSNIRQWVEILQICIVSSMVLIRFFDIVSFNHSLRERVFASQSVDFLKHFKLSVSLLNLWQNQIWEVTRDSTLHIGNQMNRGGCLFWGLD